MSEEAQNEEKVNQRCKFTLVILLSIVSLLFSITALTLSVVTMKGGINLAKEEKKVVISKQYDKGKSLDKAIATKKPILVFFYTDWCGFCQRFVPTYDKITKDKQIKENFAVAYVNCEDSANAKHVEEYGIQGFPTVYVVTKEGKKVQLDNNTFFNDNSDKVVRDRALEIIGIKK